MIGYSKKNRGNYLRECFWWKETACEQVLCLGKGWKNREVHRLEKKKKPGLKFNPGLALTGVRTTEPSRTFSDNHPSTKETLFVPKVAVAESFEWIHKLKKPNQTKDTQITNGLIHLLAQRGGKTFRGCLTWENVSLVPIAVKLAAGDNKRGKFDAEKFGRWCKTREKVSMVRNACHRYRAWPRR